MKTYRCEECADDFEDVAADVVDGVVVYFCWPCFEQEEMKREAERRNLVRHRYYIGGKLIGEDRHGY